MTNLEYIQTGTEAEVAAELVRIAKNWQDCGLKKIISQPSVKSFVFWLREECKEEGHN